MEGTRIAGAETEIPASLRKMWKDVDIAPLWESPSGATHGNTGPEQPHIWRWAQTAPVIAETARHSSPKLVERRVLVMVSPASAAVGNDAAVGGICGCYQTLLPGERARPHRHSMDALRFPIAGSGAVTYVDGKACPMEIGDLILTPGWTWHEHHHDGNEPVVWLDILNVILHRAIGTQAFQPGPVRDLPTTIPDNAYSTANFVPMVEQISPGHSPMFRYPYAEAVRAVLSAPLASDGSQRVRYVNPLNGGPCMELVDCYLLQLAPGRETTPFRSSASTLCAVVEGSGVSTYADGTSLAWEQYDTFTIPQNNTVSHQAGSDGARLFQVTDREVYSRLGLLREELIK